MKVIWKIYYTRIKYLLEYSYFCIFALNFKSSLNLYVYNY